MDGKWYQVLFDKVKMESSLNMDGMGFQNSRSSFGQPRTEGLPLNSFRKSLKRRILSFLDHPLRAANIPLREHRCKPADIYI